jgi:hypothetical protein
MLLLDGWRCDVLGDENSFLFHTHFTSPDVCCLVSLSLSLFFNRLNTIIILLLLLPSDVPCVAVVVSMLFLLVRLLCLFASKKKKGTE